MTSNKLKYQRLKFSEFIVTWNPGAQLLKVVLIFRKKCIGYFSTINIPCKFLQINILKEVTAAAF